MKSKFLVAACILAALSLFSCQAKKTVDAARAASCISSLTEDTKVVVKGGLTDELLKDIASAIKEGGNKIDLDISKTTGLTEIGYCAFSGCSGLTSVAIPGSVTEIGGYAFSECSGLTSVTIPDSVTKIGTVAFRECSGLEKITVSSGNKVYDSRSNCNAIIETSSNTLIAGCKNTVIPGSVTEIGDGAFMRCSGLTSVKIPDSVTKIGVSAFYECSGLTSVAIPDSVTEIEWMAFSRCDNLKNINASERVTRMVRNAM